MLPLPGILRSGACSKTEQSGLSISRYTVPKGVEECPSQDLIVRTSGTNLQQALVESSGGRKRPSCVWMMAILLWWVVAEPGKLPSVGSAMFCYIPLIQLSSGAVSCDFVRL